MQCRQSFRRAVELLHLLHHHCVWVNLLVRPCASPRHPLCVHTAPLPAVLLLGSPAHATRQTLTCAQGSCMCRGPQVLPLVRVGLAPCTCKRPRVLPMIPPSHSICESTCRRCTCLPSAILPFVYSSTRFVQRMGLCGEVQTHLLVCMYVLHSGWSRQHCLASSFAFPRAPGCMRAGFTGQQDLVVGACTSANTHRNTSSAD